MSAHTPRPWQVKSEFEPEYIVGDIDGPDDGTMYYQPVAMVMETKNFEANARLIAAAPDLLAACQEVMRNFAAFAAEHNIKGESLGVTACRAAIAKAEAA